MFKAGVLALLLVVTASRAEAEAYRLDRDQARLSFVLREFGMTLRRGRFHDFDATLHYDAARPEASRLDVAVRAASLSAGGATQTMLRMFEVDTHPYIRFVSTRVIPRLGGSARIEGELTMRGVTQPMTLEATLARDAPLRFSATGAFYRSAFGLRRWPWVADRVDLDIVAPFTPVTD